MPGAGAAPIERAASIAAIPRWRDAWPRCAASADFANRIHSPGRRTAPPPGAGIPPARPDAIGALISGSGVGAPYAKRNPAVQRVSYHGPYVILSGGGAARSPSIQNNSGLTQGRPV